MMLLSARGTLPTLWSARSISFSAASSRCLAWSIFAFQLRCVHRLPPAHCFRCCFAAARAGQRPACVGQRLIQGCSESTAADSSTSQIWQCPSPAGPEALHGPIDLLEEAPQPRLVAIVG